MINVKDDELIFSTGKIVYANRDIIGINSKMETYEGYDGSFPNYGEDFTPQERTELADYMISLWTKYKEQEI